MKYPFVRPRIPAPAKWLAAAQEAYDNRYFTNFGPLESRFSAALESRFAGVNTSVTLANNATAGLTAALLAHEVKGNVIIPNFTFPATLSAVVSAGCRPLLCDVQIDTGELDPNSVEHAFTKHKIAAIMPVRAYGFVRDLSDVIAIARRNKVPTIIDAAAALGASQVETDLDLTEVFSLHATKSFGIGEGGAIFSHANLRKKLMSTLNFGLKVDRSFGIGFNGKMTEIQAAIGLALIEDISFQIERRCEMARWYTSFLELNYPEIKVPSMVGRTPWSNFPVFLPDRIDASDFEQVCAKAGYQVRRYYFPTIENGFQERIESASSLQNSNRLSSCAVCLPLYSDVTSPELLDIGKIIDSALGPRY